MSTSYRIVNLTLIFLAFGNISAEEFRTDTFTTDNGPLTITFIGHGTLMLDFNGYIIHVDPVRKEANYKKLPKADLILITHEHFDHLDKRAIKQTRKNDSRIILNQASADKFGEGTVMKIGETKTVSGVTIEAVPAYNTTEKNQKFHPKGRDNGYILTLGGKRVYIAGDTEDTPEMKALTNIDIAFLPMNKPYTMSPKQVADAATAFKPEILYPYHFGRTDTDELVELLKKRDDIEVRIRELK